ncbi:VTT domain-containing protein [Telmatospirillum sp. J64-1]|uniref:VTT domain-containing protein n=1 Tax=Telmatospirillum sp. J64-1 TaxID=2502183 RepID=UPI00115DAC2C|nr:VTT domain-containing protein [Telmatospirillum sp. J64-1]
MPYDLKSPPRSALPVAVPGLNCRCRTWADRVAFLVDGAAYFAALRHTLERARHSVVIIGWEIDSRTRLDRSTEADGTEIGLLLDSLVRNRPGLDCRMLIWDSPLLYSLDREFLPEIKLDWLTHPHLRFRLDSDHPLVASHHQKLVVVDDKVAFCGGIDITARRWDCPEHRPDDRRRSDPGHPNYPPFHDLMMMVEGPVAAELGKIARQRWQRASGETPPPVPADCPSPWPDEKVAADLRAVQVAIALTSPAWDGNEEIRDVEALYLDMIKAARRFIYIENQYFVSRKIGKAIARRLWEDDPPEVVIVTPRRQENLVEQTAMGLERIRLCQRLKRLDRHDRLRVLWPEVAGRALHVHSKLMIVDNAMVRIGSANLNNRSMGVDTECDLMIESCGDGRIEKSVAGLLHRLLGEHLGASPQEVAQAIERKGGLRGAIGALGHEERRLVPLENTPPPSAVDLGAASLLVDPERPMEEILLDSEENPVPPVSRRLGILAVIIAISAVMAAFWSLSPGEFLPQVAPFIDTLRVLDGSLLALPLVVLSFVLGGFIAFPVTLMVPLAGMLFGPWVGLAGSLLGALASASLSYWLGCRFGRETLARVVGPRVKGIGRNLARHGILAVALLRMVPIAPFTVFNLVAGASHLRFRDFVLGSALGMLPGMIGLSVFGDRLAAALQEPSWDNLGLLAVVVAALFGAGWWIGHHLSRRRRRQEQIEA